MNSSIAHLLKIFLSFLFMLVIATGCVRAPFPSPKTSGLAPEQPSPAVQIAAMKYRSDFWKNFQSKLRIDVSGKSARFSSPAIVLVKAPDLVRFETFTPIGMTAALFVSNPSGPYLLIPSQKVVYTARRPESVVRRFLGGVSLSVGFFSHVLSASVPAEMLGTLKGRYQDGLLRLTSKSSAGYFEWQIASGALVRVFIGSPRFEGEVVYDPPVPLAGESVPQRIHISSKKWKMEVRVEKMRPAAQFPPGVFHLPELPGVRQVVLDGTK